MAAIKFDGCYPNVIKLKGLQIRLEKDYMTP